MVASKGSTEAGKRQVGLESQSKHWNVNASGSGSATSTEDSRHTNTGVTCGICGTMATGCSCVENVQSADLTGIKSHTTPTTVEQQSRLWTTPQAHDVATGNPDPVRRFGTLHGGANLTDDVTAWPTPNAHDGQRPGVDDKSTQGANLQRDAANWGLSALTASEPASSPMGINVTAATVEDGAAQWGTSNEPGLEGRDNESGSNT